MSEVQVIDTTPTLGNTIRDIRRRNKLTAVEIARRAGISASHLSLIETGHITPQIPTLDKIAGALGVTLAVGFVAPGWKAIPATIDEAEMLMALRNSNYPAFLIEAAHLANPLTPKGTQP